MLGLVYNNVELFASPYFLDGQALAISGFKAKDLENYKIPKSDLLQVECPGLIYQFFNGYENGATLTKTTDDFDSWYKEQLKQVESIDLLPEKENLKTIWSNTKVGDQLKIGEGIYFDVREIDLLVVENKEEDTLIHFARKIKGFDKRIIVASVPKAFLYLLSLYSVQAKATKEISKLAWDELRKIQVKEHQNCLKEFDDQLKNPLIVSPYLYPLVDIFPFSESSIWERTLDFTKNLPLETKIKNMNLGAVLSCEQKTNDPLLYTIEGNEIQIMKDNSPNFKAYFSKNENFGIYLTPQKIEEIEAIWNKTKEGDYLINDLKKKYFWWDFDNPELIIDYRFIYESEIDDFVLKPTELYFIKENSNGSKKNVLMQFTIFDFEIPLDFISNLQMNPELFSSKLAWKKLINNTIDQNFDQSIKNREKLNSYLLLPDEFIKNGGKITLY